MGRMKLGIGVAGALIVLLGVVGLLTMQGGDGSKETRTGVVTPVAADGAAPEVTVAVPTVPSTSPAQSSQSTKAPAATPTTAKAGTAKAAPTVTLPAQPTVEDIQKVIAGITAQVMAPSNTSASTKPLTREEVDALVREQLWLLGIHI